MANTGPLSYLQRVLCALLACGDGAWASHATALWLADQTDRPPRSVHVLIPATRTVEVGQHGVRVHRSRRLSASDFTASRYPRRVTVERAVVDCCRDASSEDAALAVVARTIQRGLSTPVRLHDALAGAASLPGRRRLLEAVALAGSGAHSVAEIRYAREARRHGLPRGHSQYRDVIGGAVYLDVRYDQHGGRPVVLELDGRLGHFDADSWRRDMLRDALQTASGRIVLRVPALLLFTTPGTVIGLVAATLNREGWRGALRRCGTPGCGCERSAALPDP